jgi:hypothetical protein
MQITTSNYRLENSCETASTTLQRHPQILDGIGEESEPLRRCAIGAIPRLLPAATLTAPIFYFDPHREFISSGLYSAGRVIKKRKRLSLSAARQLAFRILAETEDRLRRERAAEAEFLAAVWQPEA